MQRNYQQSVLVNHQALGAPFSLVWLSINNAKDSACVEDGAPGTSVILVNQCHPVRLTIKKNKYHGDLKSVTGEMT